MRAQNGLIPTHPNDPTTPLADLLSHDQPTINRVPVSAPPPAPRGAAGFAPGTIVGARYRIVALLGRGGMGEVYRADDLRLGQPVALKFVDLGSDARSLENLYHEVRVARQVSHPSVCRVHDVVEADGHRFIAMEYVDGEDLASLLRRIGRLPALKANDVARDIASGLAAAHDRGIVHRDLKPANVMLDGSGRAHITDFGLASITGAFDGRIAGTPAYMAPEQVAGRAVTPATDVYALGLMLHELYTGERVYAIASSYAERQKQPALQPRPASSSVKDIDPSIDALITSCLAVDPAMRPASARAVLPMLPGGDALDAAMAAGETPSPEMVAASAETGELPWRVAAGVLAIVVAGLLLLAWQRQGSLVALMRKPPEVFAERAQQIVAGAGETSAARDSVHFFEADRALVRTRWSRISRAAFDATRPGAMRFVYRRSPARMEPRETIQAANDVFIFQSGRVTVTDPALDVPGSAVIILDNHGSLVLYRANPSGRAAAADWRPMLEATGIDMTTLVPTPTLRRPPVPSDARAAWTAAYPGQSERVRIEAASLDGRPAWLHVYPSWETPAASRPAIPPFVEKLRLLLTLAFTVVALFITRRSLRRGRADRSGALRLAIYVTTCLFVAWLVAAHHASGAEAEARMLAAGLGEAAGSGLVVWLFYIALEPGVRRTWPRALIGWTRLLSGRFRDAMVGREVLLGIAGGLVGYEVFCIVATVRSALGQSTMFFVNAETLDPLSTYLGDQLISHLQMLEVPIGILFCALLARRVFGRRGAVIAFALLMAAYSMVGPGVAIFMILLVCALLYSGLLTGVAMGVTISILGSAPLTLDTDAWYWPRAAAALLIVIAAAAWAARTAAPVTSRVAST